MSVVAPVAARFSAAVSAAVLFIASAAGQNAPAGRAGLFVTVPTPLTSEAVQRVTNRIEAARAKPDGRPAVVVFDFNPAEKDVTTANFGVCYDLAKYVAGLTDVNTVAYVHKKAAGHVVLPVLACKELVMGPQGLIGDVIGAGAEQLRGLEVNAYNDLVGAFRPARFAAVRKMYDPNVQLRKGRKAGGDWLFDLRDRAKVEPQGVQVANTAELPAARDGRIGLYTDAQARDLGLSQATVESRKDLADVYSLSPASLRDDPLNGRPAVGFRYALRGPVDGGTREAVRRMAEKVIREKGNILILELGCAGGDLQAARDLANDLRKLEGAGGEDGLLIVGFVPDRAPDTAAVIALGCSEIVMSKRTDAAPAQGADAPAEATIGDFDAILARRGPPQRGPGPVPAPPVNADAWADSLRQLASDQGYPALLAEGFVNKDVEIVRARARTDRAKRRLMTAAEFEADKANWESDGVVKPKGQLLVLSATEAERLGLARAVVDTRDPNEVYTRYGLDPTQVKDARPAWLDRFAEFIKRDSVTVILVIVAFAGLILELKLPGTTVPGVISALCFILVFWAHTQFSGQIAVLAGLLFLLGLLLVLMEVFVLPGFGAAGIFGILLMLGSLALVTMTEIPQSSEGWLEFGGKMAQYLLGLAVGVGVAFFIAQYLPNIPGANRLVMGPPTEAEDGAEVPALPGAALAASLLGAVGTAVTVLRPAGSVRFGDNFVDVVTEGGYVPAGTRVQVIEVEGTRIVVKEI